MKKVLLTGLISILIFNCLFGQNVFPTMGNVGIGNNSPSTSLDIISPNNEVQLRIRPIGNNSSAVSIPSIIDFFSTFDKYSPDQGPRRTASIKGCFSDGAWGWETLSFHVGRNEPNDAQLEPLERMRINGDGNVGIGTTMPTERLSVNGNIRAKEIKVENSNWPDYVFDREYNLPTLEETEHHILRTGHLSGVPSAKEVNDNGLSLGEMNGLLLQKIEELTLHLIQINKQNNQLQKALAVQGLAIDELRSQLNRKNCIYTNLERKH